MVSWWSYDEKLRTMCVWCESQSNLCRFGRLCHGQRTISENATQTFFRQLPLVVVFPLIFCISAGTWSRFLLPMRTREVSARSVWDSSKSNNGVISLTLCARLEQSMYIHKLTFIGFFFSPYFFTIQSICHGLTLANSPTMTSPPLFSFRVLGFLFKNLRVKNSRCVLDALWWTVETWIYV